MIINLKPLKQLTASELYEKVNQEDIYSYYLGQKIKPDKLYNCCFHKDRTPSLGFYKTKHDNIRFKCFGCGEEGGAIEFVMKIRNLNYPQTLRLIQSDLGYFKPLESINNSNRITMSLFDEVVSERLKIVPIKRAFTKDDYNIWNVYGLDLFDLYKANIYACSAVYYTNKNGESKLYGYHTKDNPIYCIEISKGVYKIYRPLSPTKLGKWFANTGSEDLQGLSLLTDSRDLLIITSSMKDAVVLKKLGYQAIAPSGEGVRIPDKVLDYLKDTSKRIIYFNDSDEAGYKYTFKLAKETGFDYIFIPSYYMIKDISDFVKEFGLKEAEKLMKTLIKRLDRLDGGERERVIQNNNR